MLRLLWIAPDRADPEESFPALLGRRPAPEPVSFSDATPDLISRRLVDVVLVDGRADPEGAAAIVAKLRAETEAPFIVVLDPGHLHGFDWGCGIADFVADGAGRAELDARLGRLANPVEADPTDLVRRGDIAIDRGRFEVRVRGEVIDLTYKEFELLAYLAARAGRVCTRTALLREVWGYDFFGGTRTVDVHIRRLRAKLGQVGQAIETVRNVGYRFST
ncbi:MAG: winged helix-turn-helix transcriptional regulator [Actinomycetota bacterium]